jgi:hypothetical protein
MNTVQDAGPTVTDSIKTSFFACDDYVGDVLALLPSLRSKLDTPIPIQHSEDPVDGVPSEIRQRQLPSEGDAELTGENLGKTSPETWSRMASRKRRRWAGLPKDQVGGRLNLYPQRQQCSQLYWNTESAERTGTDCKFTLTDLNTLCPSIDRFYRKISTGHVDRRIALTLLLAHTTQNVGRPFGDSSTALPAIAAVWVKLSGSGSVLKVAGAACGGDT